MLKIYDKPSLKRVASLQKFTAAPAPIASYCDVFFATAPQGSTTPDGCEKPDN
jgi:hypothetical protein